MEKDQPSPSPSEATDRTQPLRLLVVEDHHDLCQALELFVKALGHHAQFVGNMASALQAAGEQSYDVLLCDIGLPDGDGWDLLRRLEASGYHPPYAIAMSVFNLGEDVAQSMAAGFALHLFKPFPPEDLKKALDAAPARSATSIRVS